MHKRHVRCTDVAYADARPAHRRPVLRTPMRGRSSAGCSFAGMRRHLQVAGDLVGLPASFRIFGANMRITPEDV